MEIKVNKPKKFFAILSAMLFIGLLGWNVWYFQDDPITLIGAYALLVIITVMWIAALWNGVGGFGSGLTIWILIVTLIGSGGIFITETFGKAMPLATVQIDNSTRLYPMPENPNPAQQVTIEWMEGKLKIPWTEMFEVTLIGKAVTTSALWIGMIITLLSATLFNFAASKIWWWPKKLRYISIPMEFLILATMIISMYWMWPRFETLDSDSQYGLRISWFLGLTQNWWYLGAIALITKGVAKAAEGTATAEEKYEETEKKIFKVLANLGFIFSGITFMWYKILTLTINPTHIAWKVCGDLLLSTPITNSMCFQANQHGILFFTFASAVYVWLAIRIKSFFRRLFS